MPICRKGKQRLTEHTVLTGLQPEPFCLFIHTAVCLLKEKGQLSSSLKRKQKASMCWQEQSKVCNKMDALKIEGDKHNVVYISGGRPWGKRGCPHTQGPPYTRPETHRILCGSDFRWRDWEMWGEKGSRVVSQVTPMRRDISFKLSFLLHTDEAFEP